MTEIPDPNAAQAAALPEPARMTPVAGHYDVLVCGGGPAGVTAAIRAARSGARTGLIEVHGCLGGVWTAGMLAVVIDADKPGGILAEIVSRLDARHARDRWSDSKFVYDVEQMKVVVEDLCLDAGVDVRLQTRVVGAAVDASGRLSGVFTESKSGREAWTADVFVDCTGDGDLAAHAGCRYDVGHPESGLTQPASLLAVVGGADPAAIRQFWHHEHPQKTQELLAQFRSAGFEPSYSRPSLFHIRDDIYVLMANHQYHVRADDASSISAATLRARREIDRSVQALRSLGGPWARLFVIATAEQIGIREGRRIHGRDTVVADDLLAGRQRPDAVARATFGMDVHSIDPRVSTAIDPQARKRTLPYDIPYGSLVAADVDALLMAGRCISGDFMAHSSYRVTGNATTMGESAGRAAAVCAKAGCLPHELVWTRGEVSAPSAR